jgi:hypothetical protein
MIPIGGMLSSAAGASLSQTAGSETERLKDSATQQRVASAEQKAADSAGIGLTEQDQESSERDADGRRLWEGPPEGQKKAVVSEVEIETLSRQSKDPTGQSGTQLDLTG